MGVVGSFYHVDLNSSPTAVGSASTCVLCPVCKKCIQVAEVRRRDAVLVWCVGKLVTEDGKFFCSRSWMSVTKSGSRAKVTALSASTGEPAARAVSTWKNLWTAEVVLVGPVPCGWGKRLAAGQDIAPAFP